MESGETVTFIATATVERCRACKGSGSITQSSEEVDGTRVAIWNRCEWCKGLGLVNLDIRLEVKP